MHICWYLESWADGCYASWKAAVPKRIVTNKWGVDTQNERYPALIMMETSVHFQNFCIAVTSYQQSLKQIKAFYFVSKTSGLILWDTPNTEVVIGQKVSNEEDSLFLCETYFMKTDSFPVK